MTLAPPALAPPIADVPIAPLPIERFGTVLDHAAYADLIELRARAAVLLRGRAVWCVNSTARGGGVAEMLRSLLAYTLGAGINTRWVVINGNAEFFRITKRLHNRLHGTPGDRGDLGPTERAAYASVLAGAAAQLAGRVRPGDVVLLHDPQTAGLAAPLCERGAHVIWRAHIGVDVPNALVRQAQDFLRPMLDDAGALVFTRERFVWDGLAGRRIAIIPPSIDVFSAKNQDLAPGAARAILVAAGLMAGGAAGDAAFVREDGRAGRVRRRAIVYQEAPLTGAERIVAQVSRWDALKDPIGVLRGFVAAPACARAHLVLAGPAVDAVADDPEGAQVLDDVVDAWRALPLADRQRTHIACLPMDDPEENAAIVNALQTRADVVVQKSLAEGFGLTVAEAMWKGRPVVASAVGGIQDQIVDRRSGVLLPDPRDLAAFGSAVGDLLGDDRRAARLGAAARASVRERFLEPRHLAQWVALIQELL